MPAAQPDSLHSPKPQHPHCPDDIPVLQASNADPGFGLMLQSGVQIRCTTGIPLMRLLTEELGLSAAQVKKLDVFLLDGRPVDTPNESIVPSGARLALAAGLPGIAGLAMKSNSAVRGLRPGITHGARDADKAEAKPEAGAIELVLYSLALKYLAGHFLAAGLFVPVKKLLELLQTGLHGEYSLGGVPLELPAAIKKLSCLAPESPVFFRADIQTDAR